ncbi:MAG TPA: hypothetical protein DCE23_06445 [Firmicutes bacterium]|nr:hypothetical protein [Bacillota bacterium]
MNCKYCGAALPTKGGVCPECGKMIPISQQKEMREMLDPRWNQYRNKDTALYKSASNNDRATQDAKLGKIILIIFGVILAIIVLIIL